MSDYVFVFFAAPAGIAILPTAGAIRPSIVLA